MQKVSLPDGWTRRRSAPPGSPNWAHGSIAKMRRAGRRCCIRETDGSTYYYSVMVTRADSGITSIEQMKGHSLAFADPNSTSGYLIPSATLKASGIDLSEGKYFSRTGFAGGHEQGVVAVLNKQYDACVTWTSGQGDKAAGYSRGNLRSMVAKGMLKMSDINVIWQSGKIPNGLWAIRSAIPDSLKKEFAGFMLDLPKSHHDVFDQARGGEGVGYVPATDGTPTRDIIELREAERPRQSFPRRPPPWLRHGAYGMVPRRARRNAVFQAPGNRTMTSADPAWQLFQKRFGALRRARRTESALIFVILLLLFAVSAVWTDFSPARITSRVCPGSESISENCSRSSRARAHRPWRSWPGRTCSVE